jgi:hypothetical protein
MSDVDTVLAIVANKMPRAGVRCLLIGGFAVNYHGYSRSTLDVDFMVIEDQADSVRRVMADAGFINVTVLDNVVFFRAPGSAFRADFLRVDRETMEKLEAGAISVRVRGHEVRVPALRDLISMKIFALSQSTERRMGKDLPDIGYLTVINNLDLEKDIRPLCERFGTLRVYELIRAQVEAIRSP